MAGAFGPDDPGSSVLPALPTISCSRQKVLAILSFRCQVSGIKLVAEEIRMYLAWLTAALAGQSRELV